MSTIAIVPIRGLTGSKSRLAPVFDAEERMALVWAMARGVINALPSWVEPVVITKSPADVTAHLHGIRIVAQLPEFVGLNGALTQGHALARKESAHDVLMISADLPIVTCAEVERMLYEDSSIVIAGDRAQTGTNGMRLPTHLAGRFRFHMGTQSFTQHLAEARSIGASVVTVYERGLAHDLDTPEDWSVLPQHKREELTECMREGETEAKVL